MYKFHKCLIFQSPACIPTKNQCDETPTGQVEISHVFTSFTSNSIISHVYIYINTKYNIYIYIYSLKSAKHSLHMCWKEILTCDGMTPCQWHPKNHRYLNDSTNILAFIKKITCHKYSSCSQKSVIPTLFSNLTSPTLQGQVSQAFKNLNSIRCLLEFHEYFFVIAWNWTICFETTT